MNKTIEEIHQFLLNDQRQQAVEQIDEYGTYNFWSEYRQYLEELWYTESYRLKHFTDMTISYFRIKRR